MFTKRLYAYNLFSDFIFKKIVFEIQKTINLCGELEICKRSKIYVLATLSS